MRWIRWICSIGPECCTLSGPEVSMVYEPSMRAGGIVCMAKEQIYEEKSIETEELELQCG